MPNLEQTLRSEGTIRWTNEFLDQMRGIGDPLADGVIDQILAEGQIAAVNTLMRTLVENDGIPSDKLPAAVSQYLEKTSAAITPVDAGKARTGERLFELYGPEILLVLGFYSLPASYAAKKGVQVLYRTAYLLRRPVRRVFETTQMVVDVMTSGGLEPTGKGMRSAQKVRLMHAAIRRLIRHNPTMPWDESLGFPINQEDLAGTLMTFSVLVIQGLGRLGIDLSPEEQEAYLHAWLVIGSAMGIDPRMLPADMNDARALTEEIHRRQIAPSEEGRALTLALTDGLDTLVPEFFHGLSASMVHHFLDKDPFTGANIAEMLGVAPANWTQVIVAAVDKIADLVHWIANDSHDTAQVIRFFSRRLVSAMLFVERGGQRPPFSIPAHLQDGWKLTSPAAGSAAR